MAPVEKALVKLRPVDNIEGPGAAGDETDNDDNTVTVACKGDLSRDEPNKVSSETCSNGESVCSE